MIRKIGFSLLVLAVLVASALAWGVYRNSRLDRRFDSVQAGATEKQMVELMGKPSWVEPCGKSFGTPLPNCHEYIYRDSFAPIISRYWSVQFDDGGYVLNTYVYTSP
jgi:hypothetical protein